MAALTMISTMVIAVPSPTMGFIHVGDALVILCGVICGPLLGGLAAGLGSMLADLFMGYTISALPTFIIKFVSAFIVGYLFKKMNREEHKRYRLPLASVIAEINMVLGYFIYHLLKIPILEMSFTKATLSAGIANAIGGLLFDILQGLVGIILANILYPIIKNATFKK